MQASGFTPPAPASAIAPAISGTEQMQLVEERLNVGKRQYDRGGVRVRTYVVDTPVSEQVALRHEHVEVQRRPLNQRVGDAEALFQERDIELDETAEEIVIGKEARVRERSVAAQGRRGAHRDVRDTVRHTRWRWRGWSPPSLLL